MSTQKSRTQSKPESENQYSFKVRRLDDGTPWIVLEPRTKNLGTIGRSLIGLDLKLGTSFKEAREVAECLNRYVSAVARVKSAVETKAFCDDPLLARFLVAVERRSLRDRALAKRLDPLGQTRHMDALAAEALLRRHETRNGGSSRSAANPDCPVPSTQP
jgi:hypothetical protein